MAQLSDKWSQPLTLGIFCVFLLLWGLGGSSFTTSPTHWLTTDIGKKVNQFAGFQWCLLKFLKTFICLPLLKFSHTFALISALAVSRHQQPPKKAPLLFGATERLLRECDFQRHFLSFDVFAFSNGNRALALQMLSRAHVKNHIHSNGKKSNYVFCVMWIDKFNIEYISFGFLFIPFFLLSFCFIFEFFFSPFLRLDFFSFLFCLNNNNDIKPHEDIRTARKQTSTWNQKSMLIFILFLSCSLSPSTPCPL